MVDVRPAAYFSAKVNEKRPIRGWSVMDENEKRLKELNASFEHNVFVMMRYRTDPKYKAIETTIRNTLSNYGLQARLAKDRAFYDDLWPNIVCYMNNSKYGLVVFEEMDKREYNPNISMELGYMYALGRRCLLLKDNRMPRLPTDICGKIYKDFDTYEIEASVELRIIEWCEKDLGLLPIDKEDCAFIKGVWNSNLGCVRLDQDGLDVFGEYMEEGKWAGKIVGRIVDDKIIFRWDWKEQNLTGVGLLEIEGNKMFRGWLYENEAPPYSDLVNDPNQLDSLRIKDRHPWILSRQSDKEKWKGLTNC